MLPQGFTRSSCRRDEAAFDDAVVAKSGTGVYPLHPILSIYDRFAIERSLVPSATATQQINLYISTVKTLALAPVSAHAVRLLRTLNELTDAVVFV